MGGAEVSIRGQKASIVGIADVNVTDRVARILGQLTDGINIIDPRDRNWTLSSVTDSVATTISGTIDVSDRANRLLGIIYGNLAQLQQRPVTNELLTQLTSAGTQIDPRQIRNLAFTTDSVDTSGSNINISNNPDTNVTDRANRLLGIIYGSQSQQLLQRAATFDLQTQLRTAGAEYDARDRNWDLNFGTDQVDVSGSTITVTNAPTTPINDFNTGSNISSGSSSTHTYIATGNFKLTSIETSASGAMKIEIKSGVSGSETTKMVAFTMESNPTIQLEFHEEIQITTGQRIQVIRTNRENEGMDVFSTILGFNS